MAPFAWQSDKAFLFYFTQNSASKIQFSTGVQRPNFSYTTFKNAQFQYSSFLFLCFLLFYHNFILVPIFLSLFPRNLLLLLNQMDLENMKQVTFHILHIYQPLSGSTLFPWPIMSLLLLKISSLLLLLCSSLTPAHQTSSLDQSNHSASLG